MKRFLQDSLGNGACLAAFGKHPGWDDHADDLGLVTPSLIEARRILYLEGISSQLASGAWDRLEENGEAIEFDHYWLWTRGARGNQSIAGSLWASRDGKGRGRFPMIVCAQGAQNIEFALFQQIDEFERRSKNAMTSDEVVEAWRAVSGQLKNIASDTTGGILLTVPAAEIAGLIPRARNNKSRSIRLPSVAHSPLANLKFWRRFAAFVYGPSSLLLLFQPRQHLWTDLIVGEPAPADLFSLRASAMRLPAWHFQFSSEDIETIERLRDGTLEAQNSSWFSRLFHR
ncbi:MAG TPA: hypothetical protein VIT91_16700 [Chthoniobacterales bacterium]